MKIDLKIIFLLYNKNEFTGLYKEGSKKLFPK